MRPVEEACYWLARRPAPSAIPLTGAAEADVVIIGAGLTGLWTSLALKELRPEAQVVIVEQETAAYGASGRNAGILSETIDHGHALAIQHFGEPEARRLAALGARNVSEMIRFLDRNGIGCDYEPTGRLMVALTPAHLEEARHSVETAQSLGVETFRLLSPDEVRARLRSPLYLGGVLVSGGGILDPVKLVEGLVGAAERAGVTVYQRSRVLAVEPAGAAVRVRTPGGRVTARRVVLATSAYTHHLLPHVVRRFIPLYDYILVSDPLTAEQRESIGWRGREGVTDGRAFFNYYRLTRDDRILWGTSEAVYYGGNRVDRGCDHSAAHYASLRASFRRHFPQLAGLEFPYAWGGPICATTRLTPFFGRALDGRVVYGLGFTGHGLATTRIAGRVLAHLTLDHKSELLDLRMVRRRPLPYPPEPIRGWAVRRVSDALRRVDKGARPGLLLRLLDRLGVGFSS